MKKTWFIALFVLIFAVQATPQFTNVTVEISTDRMPEKERGDLKTLEQLIPAYFKNYTWIENSYGIDIPLKISMFPQSVNMTGAERIFTAQIFISNEVADNRFYEKSFKFVYNTNDPIGHIEMAHSLLSVLDFYGWMMIAAELDTYDPLGGNSAYEKARDVATRAQVSDKAWGWKDRLTDFDELLRVRNYRLSKYAYWMIVDLIDQGKMDEISPAIDRFLNNLTAMFEENARERYTHVFLDAHARDLIRILKDFGTAEQIDRLMALDPDNKDTYQKVLNEK
ncbi:MAG: DUF4835 family protein [Candidatus Marinimicrobia bacterium]|nr:DUF4835 family protein [Candidatus Neomarinimicrobiota bacterium]